VGKGSRVEQVFGKPPPVLEGIGRKDSGERHPPGPVVRKIESFCVAAVHTRGKRRW
jgi:hypothetical protein